MTSQMLEVNNLCMYFGGIRALEGVDLTVERKKIHAVIGPNGSGKTTLFNVITGFYKPTQGSIVFNGNDITGSQPHAISDKGMARTFQTLRLFPQMTVLENVLVGMHCRIKESLLGAIIWSPNTRKQEKVAVEKAEEILKHIGLADKKSQLANSLAYGESRVLEIGRALAIEPELLLLDEPAAGMNSTETTQVMEMVRELVNKDGKTVLLVEHDMKAVMAYSDIITVLNHGKKLAEGPPGEIQKNPEVIEAYLGKKRGAQYAGS